MIPIGRGQRELIIGDRQTGKTEIAIDTIINQKKQRCALHLRRNRAEEHFSVVQLVNELSPCGTRRWSIPSLSPPPRPRARRFNTLHPMRVVPWLNISDSRAKMFLLFMTTCQNTPLHTVRFLCLSDVLRDVKHTPGDVFYLHSRLLERAACVAPEYGGGSITALPIIETQAGDVSAYIPTNVISITDGQIFLETELFHSGIMPAINPGISVSRVGGSAQLKAVKKVSGALKLLYSQYRELRSFAQFGSDLDADTKSRLALGERIVEVLKQKRNSPVSPGCQVCIVYAVTNGYLNNVPVEKVGEYEQRLYEKMRSEHSELLARFEAGYFDESDVEELKKALSEME